VNLQNTALWREALAQVPGGAAAVAVQALAGGTTNATFRVQTGQGAFVVRLHEPYSVDLGVDRQREAVLHAAAARAGLASRILAADPHGRYLITEFLDGAHWRGSDLEDESRLAALAQTLFALHALPAPAVPALDLRALLERHAAQILAQDASAAPDLPSQLARAQGILTRQAAAGRPACIVHGDLSLTNIIGSDRPRLIDWEYACVGDPLADLACLAAYYPQVLRHGAALLRGCGLSALASLPALEELAWVYRLLSDLWCRRLELARRHPPPAH
jgi:aminoglycoside phosphotransferase (APT) family kinase protein